MPDRCVSLWIGPRLGAVERACLRSVLRHGHRPALYCYRPVEGVPAGVELRDAAAVIPEARIIRHQSGSVALFSNWFRYELMRRDEGIGLDLDMYLLAPLPAEPRSLMGLQGPGLINTAVLRLPSDSPVLPPLLALFEERGVPPWLPLWPRLKAALRLWRTGRSGLARMPWGTAGPLALTALARRAGIDHLAVPPAVFYPVPHGRAAWLRTPGVALDAMIAPESVAIHLWNEKIRAFKDAPAPPGSFLARLQEEGR